MYAYLLSIVIITLVVVVPAKAGIQALRFCSKPYYRFLQHTGFPLSRERRKIVFLVMLVTLLSACGFHPRGKFLVSPYLKNMYLETSSNFTPLSQAIEKTLAENDIELASSSDNAQLILKVFNEQQINTLMTVGANQETREYKLLYSLKFSLYNKQNKLILGPRTIKESRTQIIQPNELLDNNSKTAQLYNSMREQAVLDLMYQLTAKNTDILVAQSYEN